jgi:sulfur-carrier protein adenylyltransferase/sulfurtransferase
MKPVVHKLNHSRAMYRVAVVGCGGTGAALIGGLPFLHQALTAMGHPGLQVTVADGDKVSANNCVRQPFSESEIGLFKSTVLVNRLNLFWGLKWQASTEYVTRKTQGRVDILISCVDTRTARLISSARPSSRNARIGSTSGIRLTVVNLFWGSQRTAETARLRIGSQRSRNCALERQEPFVNHTLAFHALAMLARLFRHGCLTHHGGFINLASGRLAPLSVKMPQLEC